MISNPITLSRVLLFTAAASLLLSTWSGYAQYIPNPDAVLYLSAAEDFLNGNWAGGLAVYRWPFYSLSIAGIAHATGASAFAAAQTVNAVFDCITAVAFVALLHRLSVPEQRKSIIVWAAFVILLHPRLLQLRPVVIRDHGFQASLFTGLYLLVRDFQQPRFWQKAAIGAVLLAGTLFRPEALLLLASTIGFYLYMHAPSRVTKWAIIAAGAVFCACILPLYAAWTSGHVLPGLAGGAVRSEFVAQFKNLFQTAHERTDALSTILPPGRNFTIVAYIGIATALLIDTVLRAMTLPLAVLSIGAFKPRAILPGFANTFVAWFAGWQLPLLATIVAIELFLDWRYVLAFTLILVIPVPFVLSALADEWQSKRSKLRFFLPAALAAVIVPGLLYVPRPSNLTFLRSAGQWIEQNTPAKAKIITNDPRIAYYSGRSHAPNITVSPTIDVEKLADIEYVAIVVRNDWTSKHRANDHVVEVIQFSGAETGRVVILKRQ